MGLLKYEFALGVTSYLNSETEYIPWSAALSGFRYLEEMLKRTAAYGDFKVGFGMFLFFTYEVQTEHNTSKRDKLSIRFCFYS